MVVLTISEIMHLDLNKTIEAIKNFKPLEHRIELVGTYNDIIYYNDSVYSIDDSYLETITKYMFKKELNKTLQEHFNKVMIRHKEKINKFIKNVIEDIKKSSFPENVKQFIIKRCESKNEWKF